MKKVLLSFLLVIAVLSTVIFYPFSMEKANADITTINIGDFSDLENAVNIANQTQGNYVFNVVNNFNISADEKVELSQSEVTLKGNNHSITVDSNFKQNDVTDRFNPTEINSNCFFVVKGNATLNIGTTSDNNEIYLKKTKKSEELYSPIAKYIRRISTASKDSVINIYEGTHSELGYSIAGTLNIYGGTFTDYSGPYSDRSGIQLDYVINTYSIDDNNSTAAVNIFGGTIEDNYARAVSIEGNSKCLIQGKSENEPVVFRGNHIGFDGAGILFDSSSTLTVKNALFTENKCESEPVYRPQHVGFGSAIYAKGGTVNIENSLFKDNTSYHLYTYYAYINSTVTIDDSDYTVNNCEIINNYEGLTLKNNAKGTISNSKISNNDYPGINIKGTVECNLSNTRITDNGKNSSTGIDYGAGILSNFAHNPNEADLGPATINCDNDTLICNNKATIAGSDIFAYNTKLTLPNASDMGMKFAETGEDIDDWYYDGAFSQVGPPLGPKRYGLTDTPILAEIELGVAKHYSIIAAHYYEKEEETTSDVESSTVAPTSTTESTTTVAPTTVKPTTTVAPTTVKPTTTVAPTTAKPTTTEESTTAAVPTTTEKPPLSGKCGDNIRYNVSIYEGTLYLTGVGSMYDYEALSGQPPYYYYRDYIGKVVISNGITRIGNCAFRNFFRLYSVDIPDSVKSIGRAAFQHCEDLPTIELPSGITRLDTSTFSWCKKLSDFTLPDNITSIGMYAFEGNYKLTSIRIPDATKEIRYNAFLSCSRLEYVYLPDEVEYIDGNAFNGVPSDTIFSVLENSFAHNFCVEKNYNIELRPSFSGSPAQPGVDVTTKAVTTQEQTSRVLSGKCGDNINWVFDENSKTLELSGTGDMNDYTMINNVPSYMDNLDIEKVVINDGITSIGDFAFYDCKNLKSIEMADSVTSIGSCAFEGCLALKNVSLSKSLENIDQNAFFYCNDLDEIVLPSSVSNIGEDVFKQDDDNIVFQVTPGSYAEEWAKNNGYAYNDGKQSDTSNKTTPTATNGTSKAITSKETSVAKPTIKYAKKKSAKKLKIKLKNSNKVNGYRIAVYKTKKNAKKNKKAIFTKLINKSIFVISSNKFKSKKKLFVRARSYILVNKVRIYSPWSKIIKVK